MKNPVNLVYVISLMFLAQPSLACDYPDKISIPNGSTAEKEEMLEGVQAMKKWQEALIVYRQCLEEENEASKKAIEAKDPLDEQEQVAALDNQLMLKYNASVDEETKIGAEFNEQIRLYNSKKKGE